MPAGRQRSQLRGVTIMVKLKRVYQPAAIVSAAAAVLLIGLASPTLAGDCNLNGTSDDRDIADGLAEDCNGNGIPDECEISGLQFNLGANIAAGGVPKVVRAADLNGDGIPDLLTGNTVSRGHRSVSILLGMDQAHLRERTTTSVAAFSPSTPEMSTATVTSTW